MFLTLSGADGWGEGRGGRGLSSLISTPPTLFLAKQGIFHNFFRIFLCGNLKFDASYHFIFVTIDIFCRPLSLLLCASWLAGGRWPPPANISTSKISCAFVRTFLRFQAPQLVSSFLLFHSAIWHSVKMVTQDHYFSITMITTVTIGLLVSLFSQVWHGFLFKNKFS